MYRDEIAYFLEAKSGEVLEPNGSSATATIPDGANAFNIHAEGGAIYYEVNPSGDASASSPGYVHEDGHIACGPYSNLSSLKVYGAAGAKAHIEYLRG